MTDSRVHNPTDDAFTRWLNAQPRATTRSGVMRTVDRAPRDGGSLAEYFIELPIEELRVGFAPCLVDAVAEGVTLGQLARAVTVVARRLYGVSIDWRRREASIDAAAHPSRDTAPPPEELRGPRRISVRPSARKWTPDQVREVRRLRREGRSYAQCAKLSGVGIGSVHKIVTGQSYTEVT